MRRKPIVCLRSVAVVMLLLWTLMLGVNAEEAYTSWDTLNGKVSVYGRHMFEASRRISGTSLGLDFSLKGLEDIFCANDDKVYLLAGSEAAVVILDSDLNLESVVTCETEDFSDARGIYVDTDGLIYIADTERGRILILDRDGVVHKTLELPDSDLIPASFVYRPLKLTKDSKGYTYVLSEGSYYGALMYSPDDQFIGFYGANTVSSTPLQALSYVWDLLTSNNIKQSKTARTLPYQFSNLFISSDDFVYTCTGATSTSSNGSGQIQMLSPSGTNVLYKREITGSSINASDFNFAEDEYITRLKENKLQSFVDLTVDEKGFIYSVDRTYGKIYIYDHDCNQLSAFGGGFGAGDTLGTFTSPSAIGVQGERLLIADAGTESVTVFKPTTYGLLVLAAQGISLTGDYQAAAPYWEQVLSMDANSRLAYRGLARAYYQSGDYVQARDYARLAADYTTYGQAYEVLAKQFIENNFSWLFLLLLAAVGGIAVFMVYTNRHAVHLIRNEKCRTVSSVMIHPFDSFNAVRYKNQGSVLIAAILMVVYFALAMLCQTHGGFLFSNFDKTTFNMVFVFLQTVGLVTLWCVANWLVTTPMQGKGRLKDIFISTAYALLPMLVERLLFLILSQVLPLSMAPFLTTLHTVALIYSLFLLCVGAMTIHEYGFGKFLLTSLITLLGIILIVFIVFMLGILLQQFWDFLVSVYVELAYR